MRSVSILAGAAVVSAALAIPVFATTEAGPLLVTVTTSPNPYAIRGQTSVSKSQGIIGFATGAQDVGLEGFVTQPDSAGLEGYANATSGAAGNGVFGDSQNGNGVLGVGTGSGYSGVYGSNGSDGGIGVFGTGPGDGVSGMGANNGVFGETTAASGTNLETKSGVAGLDFSGDGLQNGVTGVSPGGAGVFGKTGSGSNPFNAYYNNAILGLDLTTTAAEGAAIQALSAAGYGVFSQSMGTAALFGQALTSTTLNLELENSSGSDVLSVDESGNLIASGTVTQSGSPASIVRDGVGSERLTYGAQMAQATAEDVGRATMTNGTAEVALEATFASILASSDYLVFVTPRGPYAVYVASQSAHGFEVRAIGGRPSMAFDYRIVGTPRADRSQPRLALFVRRAQVAKRRTRGAFRPLSYGTMAHKAAIPAYATRAAAIPR